MTNCSRREIRASSVSSGSLNFFCSSSDTWDRRLAIDDTFTTLWTNNQWKHTCFFFFTNLKHPPHWIAVQSNWTKLANKHLHSPLTLLLQISRISCLNLINYHKERLLSFLTFIVSNFKKRNWPWFSTTTV